MSPTVATKETKENNVDKPQIRSEAGAILYGVTAFAAIGGFIFGYDFGVTSGVLVMPAFQEYFAPLTPANKGALNSLMGTGAVFGCLFAGSCSDWRGRRDSIAFFALVFVVGGILQCAAQNLGMQLVGRFVSGLSVGACSVLSPLYMAELAPKEIRGRLVAFQQLMIDIGLFVSSWIDYGTGEIVGEWSWRAPYGIQIIPGLILALCPLLLPRSPRWLIEKGRKAEALAVLARVHGRGDENHPYVQQEFNEIQDNVELENQLAVKSYISMLRDPKNRRVLWVGTSIAIFQQLTGANVIMYYATLMFEQAGLQGSASLLANGIDYALMVIFCIPAMFIVDRVGRRKLMLTGTVAMGIGFILMAGVYGGVGHTVWDEANLTHAVDMGGNKGADYAVIVIIFLFVCFYAITWAPCAWIYISEIFPLRIRSKGFAFASALLWVGNVLVGQITPILMNAITFYTYVVYAAIAIIIFLFLYFFTPEPKGLSLEEVEVIFQGPIFVHNLDYDAYLSAHREDVERLRAEVEAAKQRGEKTNGSEWNDVKNPASVDNVSVEQNNV
ncbi:unnamed protein product [Umbelopsis ramanniana]